MPGAIQVTVLEFKGASSSSNPSAKSLKVSMGKRHYQTWDKGEFSFPITKLREDLVVALLDAGGNEIAHSDIRTMQIVEKVSWDDVFPINGGGHVHMKLQFVLSEEERNRIRIMRESALKKKLETNPNINLRLSETVSYTRDSVEVSDSQKGFVEIDIVRPKKVNVFQAGSSLTSATSSADSPSSYRKEGINVLQTAIIPNATDGSSKTGVKLESPQVHETEPNKRIENQPIASSKLLPGSAISDKDMSSVGPTYRDEPAQKSRDRGSQKKTPSSVKKMISAFENSQLQEIKSLTKAPSVPSQLNKFSKDVLSEEDPQSESIVRLTDKGLKKAPSVPSQLNRFRKEHQLTEDQEPKVVVHPADKNSTKFNNDHSAKNMQQTSTSVSETEPSQALTLIPSEVNDSIIEEQQQNVKELEKSTYDLTRQSTSSTATTSGRTSEEPYQESSVAEGSGSVRGTSLESSAEVEFQVDSKNPKLKSLGYYEEECYSPQISGTWIFSDNMRGLCITTAGNEAKIHEVNKISSEPEVQEKNLMHGAEYKTEKNQKKTADQAESGCGGSPGDSPNGLFGQVIKIAVILGFGVFVLLTRQREPRKKHREENHNFSTYKFMLTK